MEIFILIISSALITLGNPLTLECNFAVTSDRNDNYTCINVNLEIQANGQELSSVEGTHVQGKENADVLALHLQSGKMKRLPRGIFQLFKSLSTYIVQGLDTVGDYLDNKSLVQGDFRDGQSLIYLLFLTVGIETLRSNVFEGAENLNYLSLEACRISIIEKDAFKGLNKLLSLGLKHNYLSTLAIDIFSGLVGLEHLLLSGNFLKSIENGHVKNLTKLVRFSIMGNWLTEIDPHLIDGLYDLEALYLVQNICVDKNFGDDGLLFTKFKRQTSTCTKEESPEAIIKIRSEEVEDTEKEIIYLKQILDKYKSSCGNQVGFGADDFMGNKKEMV